MQVTLNQTEQRIATWVAKCRYQSNREKGVKNRKVSDEDWFIIDRQGIASEMAFCKLFNIYPDFSTEIRSGGHDCILHNGETVDVKSTVYPNGKLLVSKSKKEIDNGASVYVLMIGTYPTYKFAGWAYKEDVFREECIEDFAGKGETYVMRQEYIRINL